MNDLTKKTVSVIAAATIMAGVPVAAHAADTNAETPVIEEVVTQNYIVKEGDTLGEIAKRFYGNPDYYVALAKYNKIENPALIFPGQIITIPQRLPLDNTLCYDYQNNEIVITGVQQPEVIVQPEVQEVEAIQVYDGSEDQYYTIKEGDTMYCIVSKFYHSQKQEDVDKLTTYNWYFDENFTDPNGIYRGQILRIPPYAELQKIQQQDYSEEYARMGRKLAHPEGCKPCMVYNPNPCNPCEEYAVIVWIPVVQQQCYPSYSPCGPAPEFDPCGPCLKLHP